MSTSRWHISRHTAGEKSTARRAARQHDKQKNVTVNRDVMRVNPMTRDVTRVIFYAGGRNPIRHLAAVHESLHISHHPFTYPLPAVSWVALVKRTNLLSPQKQE